MRSIFSHVSTIPLASAAVRDKLGLLFEGCAPNVQCLAKAAVPWPQMWEDHQVGTNNLVALDVGVGIFQEGLASLHQ